MESLDSTEVALRPFEFAAPVQLHVGRGRVQEVGEVAARYARRALVVCGRHAARRTGALERVLDSLRRAGVAYEVFDEVEPNPLSTTVDRGVERVKAMGAGVVIGLGGGSAMDSAKLIAMTAVSGGQVWEYARSQAEPRRPTGSLPVLAVTTTSGTGSHVNRTGVLTNPDTLDKLGFSHPLLYPKESFVDVDLLAPMPPEVTRATGIDVLFQCVEPYLGRRATPFSDMMAEHGIALVRRYLVRAVRDGQDIEARAWMAVADTLGGLCIDQAGVILIHGLEHPISGHFGVTHGEGLAALGAAVLEFNIPAVPQRLARVAEILGEPVAGQSETTAARQAITGLQRLLAAVGLSATLSTWGVTEAYIPRLAEDVMLKMSGALLNNPRPASREDVETLYRRCL